jgi:hypothetical protein
MMDGATRWVILQTNALRTLPLARSLANAGVEAWTPTRVERRAGRGRKRRDVTQVEVAITPRFVFVAEHHLSDLLQIRDLPASPHPAFHVLHHLDRVPVISDASLEPLRAVEQRFRRSLLKTTRYRVAIGTPVRMREGAFEGMTGIVERGTDKEMVVNFGGGFVVTIASYLFGTNAVQLVSQPHTGLAA